MEAKQKEFLKYIGGMVLFVCFVWKYELVFQMVGWVYRMISVSYTHLTLPTILRV